MAAVAIEFAFDPDIDGQLQTRQLDRRLGDLATRQHGVVGRWQLKRIGFGRGAIDLRVASGRLRVVHRGVYAVGHASLSVDARRMGAVLAGGEGAVLSFRAAGAKWGIRQSARSAIEVTVSRPRRARPGLEFHCCRLPVDEVTAHRGIPITTVPRTIFDLAAVDPRRQVERAVHEAEVLRLWDPLSLDDLVERHPRHRGIAALRTILADRLRGSTVTKEEFEHLFIALLERAGLPLPRMSQIIHARGRTFEADCVWFDERAIVELDGYAVH